MPSELMIEGVGSGLGSTEAGVGEGVALSTGVYTGEGDGAGVMPIIGVLTGEVASMTVAEFVSVA